MNRPQMVGIGFAVAAAAVGTTGLLQSERLPLSARLGDLAPLDVNSDGRLSGNEWQSAERPAETLEKLDSNGDGFLDPSEVEARSGSARRN